MVNRKALIVVGWVATLSLGFGEACGTSGSAFEFWENPHPLAFLLPDAPSFFEAILSCFCASERLSKTASISFAIRMIHRVPKEDQK
jgi:hypothetical protein